MQLPRRSSTTRESAAHLRSPEWIGDHASNHALMCLGRITQITVQIHVFRRCFSKRSCDFFANRESTVNGAGSRTHLHLLPTSLVYGVKNDDATSRQPAPLPETSGKQCK